MLRGAFVGIDRYVDAEARELTGAVQDATALWALLSDSIDGLDAPLLVNEAATHVAVEQVLDQTLDAASEDDIVLLTFAGHGTPDHRLVLHDSSNADVPGTTISMASIADRFRRSRAKVVLLILDCCFSGGAPARVVEFGLVPRDVGTPLKDVSGDGRVLLAASSHDQEALEDPQTRHGLFTQAILTCLLEADGPVNLAALVDKTFSLVRATAAQFGYVQTPVMFGHIEGDVSLPKGVKGARYLAAFPDRGVIQTTGDFQDLAGYGIRQDVVDAWAAKFPGGLNSLQVKAINEFNVLGGKSLLVAAPTSAGKTFVGEMAAIKAISEGRKAVFLLPLKALVNEKFEDFSSLYAGQLGLRVARCSGDWNDQVGEVIRGKYDIAFFTYEKFLGQVATSPFILNQIGLVVLDEAQSVTDPQRGITVELLLTSLVSARQRGVKPQIVALSAVIGATNRFENWLGCELLHTNERPVPLKEGTIDRRGVWQYVDEAGNVQREQFLDPWFIQQRKQKPENQDVIVPLVRKLVGDGEKVIVFRNARGPASGCANYLAAELGLPPAHQVLESLPTGDMSSMSESLRTALAGGVAFHNGDLTRDERVAVEHGFRASDGGIQVLVATSTVAAGVNTPASTVVIVETGFKGADGERPYTVATYRNMAGRAGRLGYETEGKAMIIADTPSEQHQLFRSYVQGHPEPIHSSFDDADPGTWLIRLLAQVKNVERASVVDLLANTFGGYLATLRDATWSQRMASQLERLMARMIELDFVQEVGGKLQLTMLGRICGESPLSLESSLRAVELIKQLPREHATIENLLTLIEALPERDADFTPQIKGGESRWQHFALQTFPQEVCRGLSLAAGSDREYYGRCKRALIIRDWIGGRPTADIESQYSGNAYSRVGHGDVRGYADGSRFLLEAVLRIAAIIHGLADEPDVTLSMYKRLELGIPAEMLALVHSAAPLSRAEILLFWQQGVMTFTAIAALSQADVQRVVGQRATVLMAAAVRLSQQ